MKVAKNRIGEKFITDEGYEIIIVKYKNCNDLWVQFQDKHKAIVHSKSYYKCSKGKIRNPYHPSVCGVGYLGLMKDGTRPSTSDGYKHKREYEVWKGMINRCYNENQREKNITYKDAEVCDRWKCYANFLEDIAFIDGYELWLNNNDYALDKDIKGNGSKIYCLENCCFVSISDNSSEAINRNGNPKQDYSGFKVYGINIKTGEKTKVFNSMKEAQRETGINGIPRCINGEYKQSGGYKWYKVDDEN